MSENKLAALIILDGFALRDETKGNAVAHAKKPNFDRYWKEFPHATLQASGSAVGLPEGQMGNSEVGHLNIGAGRIVYQSLSRINLSIEDASFYENEQFNDVVEHVKSKDKALHIFGLLSDGGVHSHINHLFALLKLAEDKGLEKVYLHAFLDGRDVGPTTGSTYINQTEEKMKEFGRARIGTVTGRYYAMDRDNRWDRIERAYRAIVAGQGDAAATAAQAIAVAYARGETDEFIQPFAIDGYNGALDADGFFCLNFRADRAREILSALGDPLFSEFERHDRPDWAAFLGMVDYSERHNTFMTTAYPKQQVVNTLGAWIARKGLRQFRLAETEKYPHVTFFLNGGKETPEPGEDRFMPQSPKVATYDLAPEMAADEVSDKLVEVIGEGYDLIVVNYANPDMVGHTGNLDAARRACEAVDRGLGRMLEALDAAGGAAVICADHGNCETMIDPETGGPHTAHTLNPVPVIVYNGPVSARLHDGRLADLAPTVLHLMSVDQPAEMTGKSLLDLK